MIKVELINKDEIQNLFNNWGEFACKCYDTNKKYAKKVGEHCLHSGHFSGSRCEYFKFEISGISRACSMQLNRHSTGVVINQQSQRYCDMTNTNFVIPPSIQNNPIALEKYNKLIEESKNTYCNIQQLLIDQGKTKEQANEDARFALLESCETQGTWGFTLEALIHFMNKRLCSRSQWEIRNLAQEMKKAVLEVLPQIEEFLVPQCEYLTWCPEANGCEKFKNK